MRRAALPLLLGPLLLGPLLLALPALGSEPGPLAPPSHVERRGLTAIVSSGQLPAGHEAVRLVARLRRGERTACETPLAPSQGAVQIELLVRGRLLPGEYALEVAGAGDEVLLSAPLTVGSPAEQRAAASRHEAWLRGAAGALRDLAAALERRGAYHLALGAESPESAQRHAGRLGRFLSESWYPALRTAWLDLSTFERRVVLPPAPAALARLQEVHRRLGERARAWEASRTELTGGQARPPAEDAALKSAAAALLQEVWPAEDEAARSERLASWGPGPLATPPPPVDPALAQGGTYRDPALGWRLELPAGFSASAPVRPDERLTLEGDGCKVVVTVSELPEARDAAAQRAAVEALAWETFTSYKRLAGEALGPDGTTGLRLELTAEFTGSPAQVIQRSLFARGRVINLLVARPPDTPTPEWLAALEAGFALEGGGQ